MAWPWEKAVVGVAECWWKAVAAGWLEKWDRDFGPVWQTNAGGLGLDPVEVQG